jgi:predicted dehydrogenase
MKLEEKRVLRLICATESSKGAPYPHAWRFAKRGVRLYSEPREMMEVAGAHLELLIVPSAVPNPLEVYRSAVASGVAVYFGKVPTLDAEEFSAYLAAEKTARKSSVVGFNFIAEAHRLSLKQRLLSGEFGTLREVRTRAVWSRPSTYFRRAPWAGRLWFENRPVLDSCLSNELAPFCQNALFWSGDDQVLSWAKIRQLRAELYRAHLIESFDTACLEVITDSGVKLRLALSQAHAGPSTQKETLVCDLATIDYVIGRGASIRWQGGKTEELIWEPCDPLVEVYRHHLRYLTGELERPATTLDDCFSFVTLNNLAFVSSRTISAIPSERVSLVCNATEQKDYVSVTDLELVMTNFVEKGIWPSQRDWPRASPSDLATPADLPRAVQIQRALADRPPLQSGSA